jgi:hypothetical protein
MVYLVWQGSVESEGHARQIEADDIFEAAIQYAEEDVDGLSDGIYLAPEYRPHSDARRGIPLMVRDPDGNLHQCNTAIIEFEPVFGAVEVPIE